MGLHETGQPIIVWAHGVNYKFEPVRYTGVVSEKVNSTKQLSDKGWLLLSDGVHDVLHGKYECPMAFHI